MKAHSTSYRVTLKAGHRADDPAGVRRLRLALKRLLRSYGLTCTEAVELPGATTATPAITPPPETTPCPAPTSKPRKKFQRAPTPSAATNSAASDSCESSAASRD